MRTHNIPISIQKRKSPEITPNTIMSAAMGFFFCKGLKNAFEIAVVNELSVLESLKVYRTLYWFFLFISQ